MSSSQASLFPKDNDSVERQSERFHWYVAQSHAFGRPSRMKRGIVVARFMTFSYDGGAKVTELTFADETCLEEFVVEWDRLRPIGARLSTVGAHWVLHAWGETWAQRADERAIECCTWDEPLTQAPAYEASPFVHMSSDELDAWLQELEER